MEVLALIPARSGSKGIPHKNVRLFCGKPLLAHSIEHALASKYINRTIVSTDSIEYADIARDYGAEVPFIRPGDIAQDTSTDLEVFQHALVWLKQNEGYEPDICVHLRPTYPVRKIEDIDKVIQILLEHPDIDTVRSVSPSPSTPFKMWFRDKRGFLSPVLTADIKDAHSMPRQLLPQVFIQNACVDAVRTSVIIDLKSMVGKKVYGYIMEKNYDIDTEDDFVKALGELPENIQEIKKSVHESLPVRTKKTFCIDIDGVVAMREPENQYDKACPVHRTIEAINRLYEKGHHIILFTARGSLTGIDWREKTERQMKEWGVKYHQLHFGKPAADYYVDDRGISLERFYKLSYEIL
jgi:CMP-N-acetylneuraminic acid synthetase